MDGPRASLQWGVQRPWTGFVDCDRVMACYSCCMVSSGLHPHHPPPDNKWVSGVIETEIDAEQGVRIDFSRCVCSGKDFNSVYDERPSQDWGFCKDRGSFSCTSISLLLLHKGPRWSFRFVNVYINLMDLLLHINWFSLFGGVFEWMFPNNETAIVIIRDPTPLRPLIVLLLFSSNSRRRYRAKCTLLCLLHLVPDHCWRDSKHFTVQVNSECGVHSRGGEGIAALTRRVLLAFLVQQEAILWQCIDRYKGANVKHMWQGTVGGRTGLMAARKQGLKGNFVWSLINIVRNCKQQLCAAE